MSIIEFKNIKKTYDNGSTVIEDFSLDIKEGEFVVFLGPSGSGKSTSLRMLAGLEEISGGDLMIRGQRVNELPSKDRGIAMVFQNYALYPHMSVRDNIGFGLKMRGAENSEITRKVNDAMALLSLEEHADKRPGNLSGGQQQRVALGRAIVRDSDIFLMDEPLSNLDARLRGVMREEIVNLHNTLKATTVYVTHDQVEAMTMADRIVIMDFGEIQQVGTPKEVYDKPANTFVANFIGNPSMNLIPLIKKEGHYHIEELPLRIEMSDREIILGIRPENLIIDENAEARMVINYMEDLGAEKFLSGKINGHTVIVRDGSDREFEIGQEIGLEVDRKKASYFDKSTGERLEDLVWI